MCAEAKAIQIIIIIIINKPIYNRTIEHRPVYFTTVHNMLFKREIKSRLISGNVCYYSDVACCLNK
jgi:hypothetical protein